MMEGSKSRGLSAVALQDIGCPIAGDYEGRLSHPRLFGQPFIPLSGLSHEEADALLWAIKQAEMKEPYKDLLDRAEHKLRLLGLKRKEFGPPDEAITALERGVKSYDAHQETILTLVEAIMRKRSCLIEYQTPSQEKIWKIQYDAYRLIKTQGGLYCIGWLPSQKRIITLAVERIQQIVALEREFTVVPGFDPKKLADESFGIVWEKPMNVVIRFCADQAPYVAERQWHPTQRIRYLKDGRLELSFKAGGMFEIVRWILSWGDAAVVAGPKRLREHIVRCLDQALQLYSHQSI
jgi:predicted DNA-binding transcriptional regulator YafY